MLDKTKLYNNSDMFFELGGDGVMKLSSITAKSVCKICSSKEILIGKIEGGIWQDGVFEAKYDCIWDSDDNIGLTRENIVKNNQLAYQFIDVKSKEYNAYIITLL